MYLRPTMCKVAARVLTGIRYDAMPMLRNAGVRFLSSKVPRAFLPSVPRRLMKRVSSLSL